MCEMNQMDIFFHFFQKWKETSTGGYLKESTCDCWKLKLFSEACKICPYPNDELLWYATLSIVTKLYHTDLFLKDRSDLDDCNLEFWTSLIGSRGSSMLDLEIYILLCVFKRGYTINHSIHMESCLYFFV
jgi:hypothetical protein